ncbi:hypothetical protein BJ875DRAFT_156827 [Amylocarpus encephaloides]|uniref:Uncharacterized protein n=1 Tax=Amylocarpus encephaloides TaxID=45428 RepID=A0A9P8C857_9HELO|nr:hypothetical protein BJ875DRAFT_156827 [Amylocarpus encephaloides]
MYKHPEQLVQDLDKNLVILRVFAVITSLPSHLFPAIQESAKSHISTATCIVMFAPPISDLPDLAALSLSDSVLSQPQLDQAASSDAQARGHKRSLSVVKQEDTAMDISCGITRTTTPRRIKTMKKRTPQARKSSQGNLPMAAFPPSRVTPNLPFPLTFWRQCGFASLASSSEMEPERPPKRPRVNSLQLFRWACLFCRGSCSRGSPSC